MKPKLLLLLAFCLVPALFAGQTAQSAIEAVLQKQVDDWNRADIPAFVTTYAEDCVFVGSEMVYGREKVKERYQKRYATPEAMGHLTFSDLKIKQIAKHVAVVTGAFQLARSAAGGGPAKGIFSLVLQWHAGAWQIVLDHTS